MLRTRILARVGPCLALLAAFSVFSAPAVLSVRAADPAPVTVAAAASLIDVLPKVGAAWTAESGREARFTFESSSRLAKQIEAGQKADIFVSADFEWMDYLQQRSLVATDTRVSLLGNRLVIAVPARSTLAIADAKGLADPAVKRIGLANETVPAGKYGRAALAWAGVLDEVAARIVSGDNVRTVLGWVGRAELEAGLVYTTDAKADPATRVAYTFPVTAHPPIVYPAALLAGAPEPEAARGFLAFCRGPAARALFEAAGFTWLADAE